jgi:hypothetical protein
MTVGPLCKRPAIHPQPTSLVQTSPLARVCCRPCRSLARARCRRWRMAFRQALHGRRARADCATAATKPRAPEASRIPDQWPAVHERADHAFCLIGRRRLFQNRVARLLHLFDLPHNKLEPIEQTFDSNPRYLWDRSTTRLPQQGQLLAAIAPQGPISFYAQRREDAVDLVHDHSTSNATSSQPERTEPSGPRRCRDGTKSSPRREPDVPGDLLRALFGNVTEPRPPFGRPVVPVAARTSRLVPRNPEKRYYSRQFRSQGGLPCR